VLRVAHVQGVCRHWQRPTNNLFPSVTAPHASRILVSSFVMAFSINCMNMSLTLWRGIVWSQKSMKDIAAMRSQWSVESGHSCVSTFTVFGRKRDILSSIGPREMGNGLGPESDQLLTIWVTLSIIWCWLQWLEICFANCLEVSAWRSWPHCPRKGLSGALSACWIFPKAFALRGIGWRGDCPCVSILSAALECMSPTSWSGVRTEMRPSWGGSISLLVSFWQRMFFGIRAKATAVPPEDCSYIRLP